jgi:hypothetical protein
MREPGRAIAGLAAELVRRAALQVPKPEIPSPMTNKNGHLSMSYMDWLLSIKE